MYLRSGFLALLVVLISSEFVCSQTPECVDHSPVVLHEPKHFKINIVGVEFRGEDVFSEAERAQLVDKLQSIGDWVSPGEPDTYWVNGLRALVTKSLCAKGFITSRTQVTPYLVRAEPDQRSYVVSFEIETGSQYRVGKLQVVEATAFTPTQLMKQIQLSPGELYDETKLLGDIKSIKKLYGIQGYIDMTAGPNILFEKGRELIDVSVDVHEGTQYRVGTVEILGLGAKAENLLKSILKPGEIFDRQSFTDFLKENRGLLPVDASDDDITIGRNLDEGTLEIVLDFRRCSGDKIPFPPVKRSTALWDKSRLVGLSDHWFQLSD